MCILGKNITIWQYFDECLSLVYTDYCTKVTLF